MALLEARPYRPFKSSEEYLEAMKEDLAEWLSTQYPELLINAENFMERLDTGVALCKHANYVRQAAEDYLARRQARNKSMTRSMTSGLAGPILAMGSVHYLLAAKSGTFFARDNVSNFITWCRKSLKIIECLLFETDDLIMRKNEKHVILCLLEVARRGAKFGMLAPMLVQMERQIDREIAADNKANGIGCGTQTDNNGDACGNGGGTQTDIGVGTDSVATNTATDLFDTDDDSDTEDADDEGPMLMYGPQPQIITNDLKSLDEMVRDLVEKCTCPSQFPMVRVSEGKYRIGDTKVLIFVRILRSHVMVRVGGGWDTLSHYLDKHDPCRCKAQHRASVAARLIPRTNNQSNGIELHKAQVIFERSPPAARKLISNFNHQNHHATASVAATSHNAASLLPSYGANKIRSRSPTPQRKFLNQLNANASPALAETNAAATADKLHPNAGGGGGATGLLAQTSPGLARRSMSPSPRRLIDMRKKQNSLDSYSNNGPKSLPLVGEICTAAGVVVGGNHHVQFESLNLMQTTDGNAAPLNGSGLSSEVNTSSSSNSNKFENISDNGSEISDEGYRSLGVIQSNAQKRESLHSQASIEDAESNARLDQTSSDSQLSPVDDTTMSTTKTPELPETDYNCGEESLILIDAGPQSLPANLSISGSSNGHTLGHNKFEQSGIFITDDEITVDIASNTGLRKTGFSNKIFGGGDDDDDDVTDACIHSRQLLQKDTGIQQPSTTSSKIPRSPSAQRRRRSSIDNSTCNANTGGSLQDLTTRTGLPVFNRKKPVYRSVRKPPSDLLASNNEASSVTAAQPPRKSAPAAIAASAAVRDVTNTWSGRSAVTTGKKRPTINADTFAALAAGAAATSAPAAAGCATFERNTRTRSSQILYDSNGRRIKGCTTASLTTSPVKNHASSPLAQQLLEAASSAKNDAQILEKMKTLLSRYSSGKQAPKATTTPASNSNRKPTTAAVFDDFTSAWVHSNGTLERSSSCSPPTKTLSKRSSAASSTESTHSRDVASVIVSPRRERGMSKIPAPVMRQHTELY